WVSPCTTVTVPSGMGSTSRSVGVTCASRTIGSDAGGMVSVGTAGAGSCLGTVLAPPNAVGRPPRNCPVAKPYQPGILPSASPQPTLSEPPSAPLTPKKPSWYPATNELTMLSPPSTHLAHPGIWLWLACRLRLTMNDTCDTTSEIAAKMAQNSAHAKCPVGSLYLSGLLPA